MYKRYNCHCERDTNLIYTLLLFPFTMTGRKGPGSRFLGVGSRWPSLCDWPSDRLHCRGQVVLRVSTTSAASAIGPQRVEGGLRHFRVNHINYTSKDIMNECIRIELSISVPRFICTKLCTHFEIVSVKHFSKYSHIFLSHQRKSCINKNVSKKYAQFHTFLYHNIAHIHLSIGSPFMCRSIMLNRIKSAFYLFIEFIANSSHVLT